MKSPRVLSVCSVALLALMVIACASPTISDRYEFENVVSEDSSKRFTYGFSTRESGRNRPRSASVEDMKKELGEYMAISEYCIEGYFIYDESFDGTEYLLHGECQESKNNE